MRVTVISPEAAVFDGEADSVIVPAFDGELGILANHAPLMTTLGRGTLTVRAGGIAHRFGVQGGFLQVVKNSVRVLAEHVTGAPDAALALPTPLPALLLCSILTLAAAAPAAAQSTSTPTFQAPYRAFARSETGITFSDPGPGFALEGSYRISMGARFDAGVRGGFADNGRRMRNSLLLGLDTRTRILDHSESFPLDGSLTIGFGFRDTHGATVGYLPVGFSMGRRILIEGSATSLVAYVQPTITPLFADGSGTAFTLGFGTDLRVSPRLDLRFSGGVGDLDGIAFTVAFLH